ncbi:site-2 protease family protein, partial [Cobetia sp. SIMBA_158]|uniref:hypothetical protein n=1 Tax=Cobetia sp. SIMBA_158 TaxID=3081617 RepID=UPI0039811FD7
NKCLQFSVKRQHSIKSITVAPQGRVGSNGIEQGFLGVAPVVQQWPEGYVQSRSFGPLDSIVRGTKETWRLITLSFDMIGNLITGQVSV